MADYVGRGLKTKLILPFAVSAEDRIKAFTKDIEMGAILYLAESDREKGESHILKKPDEKLVFLAEACYPIWLVPWNGGTLLFDGFGVTAHTLSYDTLPDIKAFNDDIKGSTRTRQAYSVALSRNANYFKNFSGEEEKTIEGLIGFPDFIEDFFVYLSEVGEAEKPLTTEVVLSPVFNESEISASIEELSELRAKIEEDVKDLDASMKLLSITTREKIKEVREEIKEVRKKSDKRIGKAKLRVARKIRQIQKKYDEKITRMSKRLERQLRLLHKDQVKHKRMQKRLTAEINRCQAKIKSCRRRKNKESEIQWTRTLRKIRKKLPTLGKKVRDIDRKIEDIETAKKRACTQQRIECDTRIEEVRKVLRELEASREARIKVKRQEITSLEDTTSLVMNQMNEMAKSKRAALYEFHRMSMPRRRKAYALVHLPFYLARYERKAKKRYVVYPPSIVGGMGILTKMKGVLGVAKMKAFLQPRSEAITVFLNQLVTLIQKNPVFEKEVTDAAIQGSVLRIKELRIGAKRGLKELKHEKWISKDELRAFSKLLYTYA